MLGGGGGGIELKDTIKKAIFNSKDFENYWFDNPLGSTKNLLLFQILFLVYNSISSTQQ